MNKDERAHKQRVAALGCMVCRRVFNVFTPDVELHHRRAGMGWGKGDYRSLIPLCFFHHRGDLGVHGLGTRGFVKHYNFSEHDLLDDVFSMIGVVV